LIWVTQWKTISLAPQAALEGTKMLKCLYRKMNRAALILAFLAGWAGLSGCQTPPTAPHNAAPALAAPGPDLLPSLVLKEGDALRIAFSGAHSLDGVQTIRPDGKITLEMGLGELKAAGLTAPDLEQQLLKAYGDKLVVKEVSVVVQSSVFKIYVTGAVLRPGPIISERVLTPLEAVMEAGIDTAKANLKDVLVVREHDNGNNEQFKLNLKDVINGAATKPFTLQSSDKIIVKERFAWF
jgi:protein involved in polysaccharide export with SLBB domain